LNKRAGSRREYLLLDLFDWPATSCGDHFEPLPSSFDTERQHEHCRDDEPSGTDLERGKSLARASPD